MHKRQFSGKADIFFVFCETCDARLEKEAVVDDFFEGWRITCTNCQDDGLVYDDGGIYKLLGADETSIAIHVK